MKKQLLMGALAVGTLIALSSRPSQAASLSFSANDAQGSDAVNVDITATDVSGGIQFDLLVNDLVNTGDILAAYVDFVNTFNLANITSVTGAFNNNFGFNTGNIVGGNIGKVFDLGVQLSDTGSSGGLLKSTSFTVLGTGLDVSDILGQQFAVRLQSVGTNPTTGGRGSAKQFGTVPSSVAIPTPALLPGLIGMGLAAMRKKKQAAEVAQEA